MPRKQGNTVQDKSDQSPFDLLDPKEQQLIIARLEGVPMYRIATELKYNYSTLRNNFSKGGRFYDAYIYMQKETRKENKRLFKLVTKTAQAHAMEAVMALVQKCRYKQDPVAARELLSLAGFHQKLDIDHTSKEEPISGITYIVPAKTDKANG